MVGNSKNTQHENFKRAALELECRDSEQELSEHIKRVARHRPDHDRLAKLMDNPKNLEEIAKEIGQFNEARAVVHASDCALHNAPALNTGECNCGATVQK